MRIWAAYKERKAAQPQPAEGSGGKGKGKKARERARTIQEEKARQQRQQRHLQNHQFKLKALRLQLLKPQWPREKYFGKGGFRYEKRASKTIDVGLRGERASDLCAPS